MNHLRNERRNEVQTQQENMSNRPGNFDQMVDLPLRNTITYSRPQTRGAGFSLNLNPHNSNSNSNIQNNNQRAANYLNSMNTTSSIQPGGNQSSSMVGQPNQRPSPLDIQQQANTQRINRQERYQRQRYLQILRLRIPTFDDNFMSRSDTLQG